MSNDLVQWNRHRDTGKNNDSGGDEEEWDLPPTDPRRGPLHNRQTEAGARQAENEASHARDRGDTAFASQREGDAAELRQKRWDWGDARTWVWIVGMCLGFLLFSALIYFLPQGRHNQRDVPASTPTIRVY